MFTHKQANKLVFIIIFVIPPSLFEDDDDKPDDSTPHHATQHHIAVSTYKKESGAKISWLEPFVCQNPV